MTMSAADLVAAWDRGESIPTIEMGGLGPGYEQAIQIAAVEFTRATLDFKRTEDKKEDYKRFEELCLAALQQFDDELGGISGAMFGAAANLAWQWVCGDGPEALQQKVPEERRILCSRLFPKAPPPP